MAKRRHDDDDDDEYVKPKRRRDDDDDEYVKPKRRRDDDENEYIKAKRRRDDDDDDDRSSGGGIAIHPSIITGVLMMVGAVVWFVLGYMADRIFIYPPILFVLGIGSVIAGFRGTE